MKIIFSPSKEMKTENKNRENWNISNKTKNIEKELLSLSKSNLEKALNINGKQVEEVLVYLNNFSKHESYKAIDLYNGLSFRNLDFSTLDQDAKDFLKDNLYILSAFYGPINIYENIKEYRLDFNSKLVIDEISLKNYWKDDYNSFIERGDLVFNLASNEFSDLINRKDYRWIDFEFYEEKNSKLKKHSTISKKARGQMVRFIGENKIVKSSDLEKFNYLDYKYSKDLSSDEKFVFIREV